MAETPKPLQAAVRVSRYLEGRRLMPGLDQEELLSVHVLREDDGRPLLVSDLQALIDYVQEV